MAALPLGPQSAAGGVSLPDSFAGELQVRSVSRLCSRLAFAVAHYRQVLELHKGHLVGTNAAAKKGPSQGLCDFKLLGLDGTPSVPGSIGGFGACIVVASLVNWCSSALHN